MAQPGTAHEVQDCIIVTLHNRPYKQAACAIDQCRGMGDGDDVHKGALESWGRSFGASRA